MVTHHVNLQGDHRGTVSVQTYVREGSVFLDLNGYQGDAGTPLVMPLVMPPSDALLLIEVLHAALDDT